MHQREAKHFIAKFFCATFHGFTNLFEKCDHEFMLLVNFMTVLGAKLGHGYVFMSQQNSLAPTFVTTCLLSKFWEEHGLDHNAVHLVVHTYGDRQRIPGSCNILGEPFNPPRVIWHC